jgi:hypothetical protein
MKLVSLLKRLISKTRTLGKYKTSALKAATSLEGPRANDESRPAASIDIGAAGAAPTTHFLGICASQSYNGRDDWFAEDAALWRAGVEPHIGPRSRAEWLQIKGIEDIDRLPNGNPARVRKHGDLNADRVMTPATTKWTHLEADTASSSAALHDLTWHRLEALAKSAELRSGDRVVIAIFAHGLPNGDLVLWDPSASEGADDRKKAAIDPVLLPWRSFERIWLHGLRHRPEPVNIDAVAVLGSCHSFKWARENPEDRVFDLFCAARADDESDAVRKSGSGQHRGSVFITVLLAAMSAEWGRRSPVASPKVEHYRPAPPAHDWGPDGKGALDRRRRMNAAELAAYAAAVEPLLEGRPGLCIAMRANSPFREAPLSALPNLVGPHAGSVDCWRLDGPSPDPIGSNWKSGAVKARVPEVVGLGLGWAPRPVRSRSATDQSVPLCGWVLTCLDVVTSIESPETPSSLGSLQAALTPFGSSTCSSSSTSATLDLDLSGAERAELLDLIAAIEEADALNRPSVMALGDAIWRYRHGEMDVEQARGLVGTLRNCEAVWAGAQAFALAQGWTMAIIPGRHPPKDAGYSLRTRHQAEAADIDVFEDFEVHGRQGLRWRRAANWLSDCWDAAGQPAIR